MRWIPSGVWHQTRNIPTERDTDGVCCTYRAACRTRDCAHNVRIVSFSNIVHQRRATNALPGKRARRRSDAKQRACKSNPTHHHVFATTKLRNSLRALSGAQQYESRSTNARSAAMVSTATENRTTLFAATIKHQQPRSRFWCRKCQIGGAARRFRASSVGCNRFDV